MLPYIYGLGLTYKCHDEEYSESFVAENLYSLSDMSVLDIEFEDDEHITEIGLRTAEITPYSDFFVLARIEVRTNQGKIHAAGGHDSSCY